MEPTGTVARGEAADVFAAAHESFARALDALGSVSRCYAIAGRTLRVQFAGDRLVPVLTPALAHVECDSPGTPVATIGIWDGESAMTDQPSLPEWWWDAWSGRGERKAVHDGRFFSAVHNSTLSLFDARTGVGLYWVRAPDALGAVERAAPLLRLLHWALQRVGLQLVHGGAVGDASGAVLLAGRGGAGKSTLSLMSLASGLRFVADDYCVLPAGGTPLVHGLYASAKVEASDVDRFPALRPTLANAHRLPVEKALFLLQPHFEASLARTLPLRAVVVPRVTGRRDSHVTTLPASAALLALAPSTLFQLPGAGPDTLAILARLVSLVPTYQLDAGTDLSQIPGLVLDVLRARGAPDSR
jgi:hypothetical protein